jgi:hypothetical protein
MSKRFDIHDWQAKQRLTEQSSPESMSNADIRALQIVVSNYSLNKVLNTLAVIADKTGKHDEAYMIQKLASQIQDFPTDMDEMNTTGTGASFNAGSGAGYMTPNAFKKKKKK